LARLEEKRLREAGAGKIWEDACNAADEWIDREGMVEGLTDPGAANRWKAVGPAEDDEPGRRRQRSGPAGGSGACTASLRSKR